MRRVAVTGLGFITSIGNDKAGVVRSLRECRTGIEPFAEFAAPDIPVKLAGTIKEFEFPTSYFEDWRFPARYTLPRERLRPMAPNTLFGYCAMQQAVEDARLSPDLVAGERTGLMSASGGSMWMAYENLQTILTRGVQRCQPMAVVNSIPGALYTNLAACFRIRGATLGFASACSSSSHAFGGAFELVRRGQQDIVFVVGAEDCNKHTILPFAAIRALSVQTDPSLTPCAFDRKRDGFVGTGGAAALVVEDLDHARRRGAPLYAEVVGWGQASDGYNVVAPEPEGRGLSRAMQMAIEEAKLDPVEVDYINAHATSTPAGDESEIRAIKRTFAGCKVPYVSSTKSLTGHALSAAGAIETAFCCLALHEQFVPVSAHITELDPMCDGVPVVTHPVSAQPRVVLNNASGFGGTNVCVALRRLDNER